MQPSSRWRTLGGGVIINAWWISRVPQAPCCAPSCRRTRTWTACCVTSPRHPLHFMTASGVLITCARPASHKCIDNDRFFLQKSENRLFQAQTPCGLRPVQVIVKSEENWNDGGNGVRRPAFVAMDFFKPGERILQHLSDAHPLKTANSLRCQQTSRELENFLGH